MSYIEELFSLKGRKVVVTGGGGAIPGSIAAGLAKAGADVCLWGRGTNHPMSEAAKEVRAEAGPGAGHVEAITVDTGDAAACERAVAETETLIGPPDVLINGVGGNRGKAPFVDLDEKLFREVLELNLLAGLVTPTKAFARYWIARGIKGNVVMMASMTSYKPLSGVWAYDAAKSALLNLTEGLAKELAPQGIRVNGIAPGFFIGNQNRALLIDEKTGEPTARGKAILARTPFGRFGEKSELRGAVIFLISDRASGFVTGVTIPVDGGYLTDNI
ncbi:MAG: SDR family oxidoreductase [Deltaproteobacteria bacterium]|nr:SDR family oxidoreductase [Deltaproteobacteria bacterium]